MFYSRITDCILLTWQFIDQDDYHGSYSISLGVLVFYRDKLNISTSNALRPIAMVAPGNQSRIIVKILHSWRMAL